MALVNAQLPDRSEKFVATTVHCDRGSVRSVEATRKFVWFAQPLAVKTRFVPVIAIVGDGAFVGPNSNAPKSGAAP